MTKDRELIDDILIKRPNKEVNMTCQLWGENEALLTLNRGKEEEYLIHILQFIRDVKEILHKDIIVKSLRRKDNEFKLLLTY